MAMNEKLGIDSMLAVVFDTIDRVKNANDPEASDNEKLDVDQAKAISGLCKNAIDCYKVKLGAIQALAKADNPNMARLQMEQSGMLSITEGKEGRHGDR